MVTAGLRFFGGNWVVTCNFP